MSQPAAMYARVSSDRQREQDTIASQTAALLRQSVERNAEVSPDGRWIAYQSDESAQAEIYVRPFPNVEGGR